MSGESFDYSYLQVQDAAEEIGLRARTAEHRAFAEHLFKVAAAMRELDLMFACDTAPGDESAAIRACLHEGDVLESCIDRAHEAAKELKVELERACAGRKA